LQKFELTREEYQSAVKKYRRAVTQVTNKQPLYQLEHSDKRGTPRTRTDAHHLDHILSVSFGFNTGLDPEIIGDIRNLRFIPYKTNLEKKEYLDKASWDVHYELVNLGMI
jgi:hypothetical protein